MSESSSLHVLIAQLQVQLTDLHSLLVTSPRRGPGAALIAEQIASGLVLRGVRTKLIVLQGDTDDAARSSRGGDIANQTALDITKQRVEVHELGTPQAARALLDVPEGIAVVAAAGVLELPAAVFLAAAADAVLLVADRGRTAREDLARARAEIDAAGGHLVAAVLRT
ncbi:MAG TPA: hypothetical protein VF221_07650 [Chloroflexota bacterium]